MPYTGQPVPTTTYNLLRGKISDGKSVVVTVPQSTTIVAQQLYYIGGFFGLAMQAVTTGEGETASLILAIEQAEYETNQIDTSKTYNVGTPVFWDNSAQKITTVAQDNRFIGVVTVAKDDNNVICFVLSPQAQSTQTMVQSTAQADSTAEDVATIVTDFNALLAKLRTAGILASS